jgi:peroxiredoxin
MPKYNPKDARDARKRHERRYVKPVKEKKPLKNLKVLGFLIGVVVVGISLIVFSQDTIDFFNPSEEENNSIPINSSYRNIQGSTVRLSSYRGKIVIIYFHSLINFNCDIPNNAIAGIEDDYSNDLVVITISMDPGDSNSELINWRNNLNANWILVRDDNVHDYCSEWDYHRSPFAIIIDQNGYFVTNVKQIYSFNNDVRTQIVSLL